MRTFDFDAFDAFDSRERPGAQILPWEMWERERPWRDDAPPAARDGDEPPAGARDQAPRGLATPE